MTWPVSVVVLAAVALLTRWVLGLSGSERRSRLPLDERRERLCRAIALELETRSAIVAVSLDDAIQERVVGNAEIAWSLRHLTVSEWNQLADILLLLLREVTSYLPMARVPLPPRALALEYFKSEALTNHLRLYNHVDEFLFRNRRRFDLQLHVLRHAVEALTADFGRNQTQTHGPSDSAIWIRLDHDYHDFDLIMKETVLALRTFLACLPDAAVDEFTARIQPALRRGVRFHSGSARVEDSEVRQSP